MEHGEKEWILDVLEELVAINSVNPANDGPGEKEKCAYLEKLIKSWGYDLVRYSPKDDKGIERPSLIVKVNGKDRSKTIWIIAHVDTVTPGDLTKWDSNPFELKVEELEDDVKVYGRGVNDNGVGIMSSLLLLKRMKEQSLVPNYNLAIAFFSDEEAGSRYGMYWVLENTDEFKAGDFAVVPDAGNEDGSWIEIAEKGILWAKVEVRGKQAHSSMPHLGINAHLHSMRFNHLMYERLHDKFNAENDLFTPPWSTFQPTKKELNVEGINTIPGNDVVYWDCRILPEYDIQDVLEEMRAFGRSYSHQFGVSVDVETIMTEGASAVNLNSWIVKRLQESVTEALRIKPRLVGIGGGTFAGILRKKNIESVVWSVQNETSAHQTNEWELVSSYTKTADVFQKLFF